MRRTVFGVALVALAVVGWACGSSDSPTVSGGSGSATTVGGSATTASGSASTAAAPGTTAAATGGLSGTWSGDYTQTTPGPASGTFTINWQQAGSTITGSINIPGTCPSGCPISATLNGSTVTFGVVAAGAINYTGTVSGNSMSGTYTTVDSSYKGTWKASRTG